MKGLRYPPYPIPPLPSPKVLQEALDKFLEYEAMLKSPPPSKPERRIQPRSQSLSQQKQTSR